MPTVQANGLTINYEVHGAGEPLLLVNGLADDLTSWAYQVEPFSSRYQVIIFDNRGIGRTDKLDRRTTPPPTWLSTRSACSEH